MNKQPVIYYQTDPRWSKVDYSTKGEKTTIGASGCGPTAMAMVLATWCDPSVTPETECKWALAHGYKALRQGTYYAYFAPAAERYGLTCRLLNATSLYGNSTSHFHEIAKGALDEGNLVIACMGKGRWTSSGHFVLVWKIEGNTVFINDPASSQQIRTRGDYSLFKQQVKYYFLIDNPSAKEDEFDMTKDETTKLVKEMLDVRFSALSSQIEQAVLAAKPKVYNTEKEIPSWYQDAYQKVKPVLKGREDGKLDIPEDLLRILTLMDRMGILPND